MSFLEIMDIALVVLCVVTYAIQMYFKVKGDVVGAVSELVALAESSGLTGPEKMEQVVSAMSDKVPAPLRKFLTKDCLQKIAQSIFDWMRRYAKTYIEVTTESAPEEREEKMKAALAEVSLDAAATLIVELMGMTVEQLKKKAEQYDVDISGITSKDEIRKNLVLGILNKA